MKPLLIALLLTATIAYAAEPTAIKYPVVTKGRKVTFDEIQKSDLGKIMSLYLLAGRPSAM